MLGHTRATNHTLDALHTFGYGLYLHGQALRTTKSRGVAAAVTSGYNAAGGHVHYVEAGDLPHDDVVLFTDDAFEAQLDKKLPDWRQRPWITVTQDRLDDFLSTYLYVLWAEGSDLLPEHGEGGTDGG